MSNLSEVAKAVRECVDAELAKAAKPPTDLRRVVGAVVRSGGPLDEFIVLTEGAEDCQRRLNQSRSFITCGFRREDDIFVRWATREECERHGVPYICRGADSEPCPAPSSRVAELEEQLADAVEWRDRWKKRHDEQVLARASDVNGLTARAERAERERDEAREARNACSDEREIQRERADKAVSDVSRLMASNHLRVWLKEPAGSVMPGWVEVRVENRNVYLIQTGWCLHPASWSPVEPTLSAPPAPGLDAAEVAFVRALARANAGRTGWMDVDAAAKRAAKGV